MLKFDISKSISCLVLIGNSLSNRYKSFYNFNSDKFTDLSTFSNSDVDDNVESLSEFSVDLIVEGVSKCLEIILGKDDLPKKLPPNMATRFRIGTRLVEEIKVGKQ